MNGSADRDANGVYANGPKYMKSQTAKGPATQPSRSSFGGLLSLITRLGVWYIIITTAFRCPSTIADLNENTPKVCGPYLNLKAAVAPHLQPHYDAYIAPQVQKYQPYIDDFNTRIYNPATAFTRSAYDKYGEPGISAAQKYSRDQWQKSIVPHIDVARKRAGQQYDAQLRPHVDKVWISVSPYYDQARDNVLDIYTGSILPAYEAYSPYALQAYEQGHKFAAETGLPYAQQVGTSSWSFVSRYIWPRVRVLYGENVEPQLVRISERLGRYRDAQEVKSILDEVDSASDESTMGKTVPTTGSSSLSSISNEASASISSLSSAASPPVASATVADTAATDLSEAEIRQKVESDLSRWQEKFSKASAKGTEDLSRRLQDIASKQIDTQVRGVGDNLIVELEETSTFTLKQLKSDLQSYVSSHSEESKDAEAHISKLVRAAGGLVKDKAQAVRQWKSKYDAETASLFQAATEGTSDVLNRVRDLGLQEIGMRWAWMEGVTYQDWEKYHDLSKHFSAVQDEIAALPEKGGALHAARDAGEDIENRAMTVAENTAKELTRLKKVGLWKIDAKDDSDDWSDKVLPAAAVVAGQKVMEGVEAISASILGSSQDPVESATSVLGEKIAGLASSASSAVLPDQTESSYLNAASTRLAAVLGSLGGDEEEKAESPLDVAKQTVSSLSSRISEAAKVDAVKSQVNPASSDASSAASSVVSAGSKKLSETSEKVKGSPEPANPAAAFRKAKDEALRKGREANERRLSVEKAAAAMKASGSSSLSSHASVASSAASERVADNSQSFKKSVSSVAGVASSARDKLKSSASSLAGSVGAGVDQLSSAVESEASNAPSSVSKRLSQLSSQASVDASSAGNKASSKVTSGSSALSSAASSASSAASSAQSRQASKKVLGGAMAQAVTSSSGPILDDDFVDGAKQYSEQLAAMAGDLGDRAGELTRAMQEAIGLRPTSQGTGEQLTSIASENYVSALSAASSLLFGETGTVEGATSAVAARYDQAVTAASYAIYGSPTPIIDSVSSAADQLSSEALSRYGSAMSAASKQYSIAMSRASQQVVGSPKPVHEQMFSSIESAYAGARATANNRLQSAFGVDAGPTASVKSFLGQTTPPPLASMSSLASSRLSAALQAASSQYSSARSAVGLEAAPAHEQYLAEAQRQYYEGIGLAHDRYSEFLTSASQAVYGSTPVYQQYLASAQVTYSSALSAASANMMSLLASASSAAGATSKSPADSVLDSISSHYSALSSAASVSLAAASSSASVGVYGTPIPVQQSLLSAAQSQYSAAFTAAQAAFDSATSAAAGKSSAGYLELLSSQYSSAVSAASVQLAEASSSASSALQGSQTGSLESLGSMASEQLLGSATPVHEQYASAASENWAALVAAASEQVYGAPTPWHQSLYSQANDYAAQATAAAAVQMDNVNALISELISGKEPDFTDSVMSRLNSVYSTGLPAAANSASSYVADSYSTISSVVREAFTPPPSLESILSHVSAQLDEAFVAASEGVLGTSQNAAESVTSAAASVASSVADQASSAASNAAAQASQAIYGKTPSYAEQVQANIEAIASSARGAIETAVYGPTGVESATSAASSMASSVASEASKAASSAAARVSQAIYGAEEASAVESAQARLLALIEQAQERLGGLSGDAKEQVQQVVESVSSAVESVTKAVKDEL